MYYKLNIHVSLTHCLAETLHSIYANYIKEEGQKCYYKLDQDVKAQTQLRFIFPYKTE
jgi:hypothetical protein